jgi:L-fuconolactonase
MPDFPIVDSHVHLWDPSHFRMEWLDANAKLNKLFGLQEYRDATAGIQVAAMVYLEVDLAPEYKLLEAAWAADRAQEDDRLKAVIASAPMEYGDQVRAFLEALVAVSPRVKGVRRLLQGEADPAYCLQPRFLRGVELLAEFGLSFDICVYHPQLASAIEMVRRTPGTSFILDHIAKPNIRGHQLEPWRSQIEELAALPNVVCKISGVVTEADLENWTIDDVAPYVEHCLKTFGEDRVVYGGDWPVVLNGASYKRWVETLDTLTASLSPTAKRKLWHDNARHFYRLGESEAAD